MPPTHWSLRCHLTSKTAPATCNASPPSWSALRLATNKRAAHTSKPADVNFTASASSRAVCVPVLHHRARCAVEFVNSLDSINVFFILSYSVIWPKTHLSYLSDQISATSISSWKDSFSFNFHFFVLTHQEAIRWWIGKKSERITSKRFKLAGVDSTASDGRSIRIQIKSPIQTMPNTFVT